MRKLFKNRNYRLIISGNLISVLGDKINDIVLMWYIYTLSNSSIIASASLVVNYLPKIIFSPLAGILADKSNRKHTMIACDLANGLFAIILGIGIYFNANLYIIFTITFIMSTFDTLYLPSSMALIPEIVDKDELISANSLSSTINNVVGIVGPALSGILYIIISPVYLFIINGMSFIISALFECLIQYTYIPFKETVLEKKKLGVNIKKNLNEYIDGFKIIFNDKFIFFNAIVGGGIINFFIAPISVYIPIYICSYCNSSSVLYGIMNSAITIGSIMAGVVLIFLGKKFDKYKLVTLGYMAEGMALLLFGFSSNFIGSFISLIVLGVSIGVTGINMNTIVQEKIPNEVIGRCISSVFLIANISVPSGYLVGAYASEKLSLSPILIISGCIIVICGIVSTIIMKENATYECIE